jgi:hypothetical protein
MICILFSMLLRVRENGGMYCALPPGMPKEHSLCGGMPGAQHRCLVDPSHLAHGGIDFAQDNQTSLNGSTSGSNIDLVMEIVATGGNLLFVNKFNTISARCGGRTLGIVKRLCRAPAIAWLDLCAEPVVWSRGGRMVLIKSDYSSIALAIG